MTGTMRYRTAARTVGWGMALGFLGLLVTSSVQAQFSWFRSRGHQPEELRQRVPWGPACMVFTPKGDCIVSCHQFFDPPAPWQVIILKKGSDQWQPYPREEMNTGAMIPQYNLDSVMGLAIDGAGVVWMLDNGRRGDRIPKVVAWDTAKDEMFKVVDLPGAVRSTSFLTNIVVDPNEPFLYISDPANGADAALIVVDLRTNVMRRLLEGSYHVRPSQGVDLMVQGQAVEVRRPDGFTVRPLGGVNPLAIDPKGRWLYFGPMNSHNLYRVETRWLRDISLTAEQLQERVVSFSSKPVCDSIAVDGKGTVYFADIQQNTIGYVSEGDKKREYHLLVDPPDPRLLWPGGLFLDSSGMLNVLSKQLHMTPLYNGGKSSIVGPFPIFRVRTISGGMFWK